MIKRELVVACLFLGLIGLGCSDSAPGTTPTVSKFVGKIISVQWGGLFDLAPSPFFHVRDADTVTGMLCLAPVGNDEATVWVHPSKFVSCMIVTEKEVKEFAEQQTQKIQTN